MLEEPKLTSCFICTPQCKSIYSVHHVEWMGSTCITSDYKKLRICTGVTFCVHPSSYIHPPSTDFCDRSEACYVVSSVPSYPARIIPASLSSSSCNTTIDAEYPSNSLLLPRSPLLFLLGIYTPFSLAPSTPSFQFWCPLLKVCQHCQLLASNFGSSIAILSRYESSEDKGIVTST